MLSIVKSLTCIHAQVNQKQLRLVWGLNLRCWIFCTFPDLQCNYNHSQLLLGPIAQSDIETLFLFVINKRLLDLSHYYMLLLCAHLLHDVITHPLISVRIKIIMQLFALLHYLKTLMSMWILAYDILSIKC